MSDNSKHAIRLSQQWQVEFFLATELKFRGKTSLPFESNPWLEEHAVDEALSADSINRIRYSRAFSTPTGIDSNNQVCLRFEVLAPSVVRLNAQEISVDESGIADVTDLLKPALDKNRLEIVMDLEPGQIAMSNATLIGEIFLEIH